MRENASIDEHGLHPPTIGLDHQVRSATHNNLHAGTGVQLDQSSSHWWRSSWRVVASKVLPRLSPN